MNEQTTSTETEVTTKDILVAVGVQVGVTVLGAVAAYAAVRVMAVVADKVEQKIRNRKAIAND